MPERQHEHGPYYWNADSPHCNHGPDPDWNTDPEAHDLWAAKHPISDDGRICLDAPAGEACLECSAEEGDMVPSSACRDRDHRRPKNGTVPNPDTEHQLVPVWVGPFWCLERDCEEFFTDDGDDIPGKDRCSHIREEQACSCQRNADGEYDGACAATAGAAA